MFAVLFFVPILVPGLEFVVQGGFQFRLVQQKYIRCIISTHMSVNFVVYNDVTSLSERHQWRFYHIFFADRINVTVRATMIFGGIFTVIIVLIYLLL